MAIAEERFTALYERHYDEVARYVARRTANGDIRDVVASVFLTAWRRLDDIPERGELPWLYGAARRVLANHSRGVQRARRLADRVTGQLRDTESDHADQVASRLDIATAFDKLSKADQEALRLVAWERLEPAQAAQALGCGRTTFAMRLLRARRRLRAHLESIHPQRPSSPVGSPAETR